MFRATLPVNPTHLKIKNSVVLGVIGGVGGKPLETANLVFAAVEPPGDCCLSSGGVAHQRVEDLLRHVDSHRTTARTRVTNNASGGLAVDTDGNLLVAERVCWLIDTVAGESADGLEESDVDGHNVPGEVLAAIIVTAGAQARAIVGHLAALGVGSCGAGAAGGSSDSCWSGGHHDSGDCCCRRYNWGDRSSSGHDDRSSTSSRSSSRRRSCDNHGGWRSNKSRRAAGGRGLEELTRRSITGRTRGGCVRGHDGLGGGVLNHDGDGLPDNLSLILNDQLSLFMMVAAMVGVRLRNGDRSQNGSGNGCGLHIDVCMFVIVCVCGCVGISRDRILRRPAGSCL